VRAADLSRLPAQLKVIGQVRLEQHSAGYWARKVRNLRRDYDGSARARGADAVVMVEYTSGNRHEVEVSRGAKSGENIVPAGSEARANQVLLQRGSRISYPRFARAAAVGKAEVSVTKKPRIAILSTGR